jgi:hypothetical protein
MPSNNGMSGDQTQFVQNYVSHRGHLEAVLLGRVRERWPPPACSVEDQADDAPDRLLNTTCEVYL